MLGSYVFLLGDPEMLFPWGHVSPKAFLHVPHSARSFSCEGGCLLFSFSQLNHPFWSFAKWKPTSRRKATKCKLALLKSHAKEGQAAFKLPVSCFAHLCCGSSIVTYLFTYLFNLWGSRLSSALRLWEILINKMHAVSSFTHVVHANACASPSAKATSYSKEWFYGVSIQMNSKFSFQRKLYRAAKWQSLMQRFSLWPPFCLKKKIDWMLLFDIICEFLIQRIHFNFSSVK